LREAKVTSSWLSPDEQYEAAVQQFVDAVVDRRRPFMQAFLPFQTRVAELAIYNSLAQLLIKITAPGVPDFYQGTELWDLSLVDPDNRRPVDYLARRRLLDAVATSSDSSLAASLLESRTDGRVKLFTMVRALKTRAAFRGVFEEGAYIPLHAAGSQREHLFAFARRHRDAMTLTCVPRLVGSLLNESPTAPIGAGVWQDTRVEVPAAPGNGGFRNVFTGAEVPAAEKGGDIQLDAAVLFERFPIALLVPSSTS
jgi:(1->4)-alpha-D-glucan 1-alpha-D-glucosylmutase